MRIIYIIDAFSGPTRKPINRIKTTR